MSEANHAVVIVGGGPTGLMLAGELALAGINVAIVERRQDHTLPGARRAGGLHARTLEILDQRGIAERFLARGKVMQINGYMHIPLDISDFPTQRPYGLAQPQEDTERTLAEWVGELPVQVYRCCEATRVEQGDRGVVVQLSDGRTLCAQYAVGCDGGHSMVRKQAGIELKGWDASVTYVQAEASMAEQPPYGVRRGEKGVYAIGPLDDGKRVSIVLVEPQVKLGEEPTLDDIKKGLVAAYGKDFGVHSPTWLSRFSDAARQAASYRQKRILVAGDAAHVHSPTGGQGLNTGVQDAVNLGWKLAQVVKGISPESLLDTYHNERHPVGAQVLRTTLAFTAIGRGDDRTEALREHMAELLRMDEPRKRFGAMLSGLGIHYNLGDGHQLLGRRMPDLDLMTSAGKQRVYTLLHKAYPALINLGEPLSIGPWTNRVPQIIATYDGTWELPALGVVSAPKAVLMRPDGYVAWVGDGTDKGLEAALEAWFGPAQRPRSASA